MICRQACPHRLDSSSMLLHCFSINWWFLLSQNVSNETRTSASESAFLCSDNFYGRVSIVFCPTTDRQVHTALVRRRAKCVDNLPAVLPIPVTSRLCVCSPRESFLPLRKQVIVHGVLLLLATITLPITPSESLKPTGNELPTVQILLVLTQSIGLPYLVLSTTSPLVQAWFAKAHPGRSPYRLYALSNVGSLLALLGFPFLVEPWMTRTAQINWWSLGMVFYVLVCGYLAWSLRSVPNLDKDEAKKRKPD